MAIGVATMLMLAATLVAQPTPPARPGTPAGAPAGGALAPPVEVDPRTAWKEIAAAYAKGRTRERMEVISGVGHNVDARRGTLEVELHPGAGPDHADAKMYIEAGPLRCAVDQFELRAVLKDNADTAYVVPMPAGGLSAQGLSSGLPPLPVPQLVLLRTATGESPSSLLPWIGPITWMKATLDTSGVRPTYLIEGSVAGGDVLVYADAQSGRLMRISAALGGAGPDSATHVDMHFMAMPVMLRDATTQFLDIAQRIRVDTLADLSKRPSELVVGSTVRFFGKGEPTVLLVEGPGLPEVEATALNTLSDAVWKDAAQRLADGSPAAPARVHVVAGAPADALLKPEFIMSLAAQKAMRGGGLAYAVLGVPKEGDYPVHAWIPIRATSDATELGERLAKAIKDAKGP